MTSSLRMLAACVFAAASTLAQAQLSMLRPGVMSPAPAPLAAALKPDGQMRYALGAGGSYLSGTNANATSLNLGAESAVGTSESRWRFGGRAMWSRTAGETASENVTLVLAQESQHRWSGSTWLREKFSVFPGVRAGETLHTTFETGLAIATSPFVSINVGVLQRYEGIAGLRTCEPAFTTAIALRLP